ncbi:serpin family protein [Nakamurella sp. YIM 132087]|uniref:Serpin family protein n=1 Tax=Nakamurella alba TaxID=2665158 RepID=A0A7K1FHD2_9ACTN|nr:serpin family protein [Nakamurella alba]MTD13531.1 serpin family protein [Nakamurella alba]
MRRRDFLGGAGLLLAALATGCGSTAGLPSRPAEDLSSGEGSLLKIDAARRSTLTDEQARGRFADFGADLFRAVVAAGATPGNTLVSPYSVVSALGMTALGARAATLDLFRDLLGGDPTEVAAALTTADAALAAAVAAGTRDGMGKKVQTAVDAANMIWAQSGYDVRPEFLQALAEGYAAGMRVTDFVAAPEGARRAINAWVSERTHELIPTLLPDGSITDITRMVLVNALYLKASWHLPFDEDSTAPGTFISAAGAAVQTDLMHRVLTSGYAEGDGWQAAVLPYAGRDLAMTVVLPEEARFDEVGAALGKGLLLEVADAPDAEITLTFPSFESRTAVSLQDALGALGAGDLFADDIDLSGIAGKPGDLVIGDVIHEARIIVDEKGTEAAAATAVLVEAGSAPPPAEPRKVDLVVDHAFYYVIHDTATATPLFVGQVIDPTAG